LLQEFSFMFLMMNELVVVHFKVCNFHFRPYFAALRRCPSYVQLINSISFSNQFP
jgi:hypothetical protein